MISTETALTRACASFGSMPQIDTRRTSRSRSRSPRARTSPDLIASFWIGARLRCASATIATIRDSSVSDRPCPRDHQAAVPFTSRRSRDHRPASRPDRLAADHRLVDRRRAFEHDPSTGPSRRANAQAIAEWTCRAHVTSLHRPHPTCRRRSETEQPRIAAPVELRARSSSTWPTRISAVITPAASKYVPTVRRGCGRRAEQVRGERRDEAVAERDADAEPDQREHVEAAMLQRLREPT